MNCSPWRRADGKKTKLCPVCEKNYILYTEPCCAECGRARTNPQINWSGFLVYREKINYAGEHGYLVLDDEHRFVGIAFCETGEDALDCGMTLVRFFDWFAEDFGKWGQMLYKYGRRVDPRVLLDEEYDPILEGKYLPLPFRKLERSMPNRTSYFMPWAVSLLGHMQILRCDNR